METVNQEQTVQEPERTFTQAELDAIVRDRLQRERSKYADYEAYKEKAEKFDAAEEAQKSELQKATERADSLQKQLDALRQVEAVRKIREEVAKEVGIPVNLLTADTKEACEEQAKEIIAFAKPTSYPVVRDGGEVRNIPASGKTRDQFANWMKEMNGG